jgi:O-acetyl-ADP-ribose deacetylase (regulator of RNase III)
MKIILTALNKPLADAWEHFCGQFDFVTVHQGSIVDLSVDAVVSPANSFGFMDGGVDLIYSHVLGWHIQDWLQQLIRHHHHGELMVGTAEIVETDQPRIPFLIAAPTMRVPMILRDTVNPYLAARAALLLIQHGQFKVGRFAGQPVRDHVKTVAFPGLGTGVGQVDVATCARQFEVAVEHVIYGSPAFPRSWADVQMRHQQLYTDLVKDLQDPR